MKPSQLIRRSAVGAVVLITGCSSSEPESETQAPARVVEPSPSDREAAPAVTETSLDDIASSLPTHVVTDDREAEKFLSSIRVSSSDPVDFLRESLVNTAPTVLENLDRALSELETGSDLNALKYLAKFRAASLTE